VVPRFVQQALKGEPITVYGNGKQSRCFLYVKDAVRSLIALMNLTESAGEAFNLGSQEEVTIEELAKQVISLTQSNSKLVYIPYDQAYEAGFEDMARRLPDTSKAKRFVGFAPTKSLKEILESVIAYYRTESGVPVR